MINRAYPSFLRLGKKISKVGLNQKVKKEIVLFENSYLILLETLQLVSLHKGFHLLHLILLRKNLDMKHTQEWKILKHYKDNIRFYYESHKYDQ